MIFSLRKLMIFSTLLITTLNTAQVLADNDQYITEWNEGSASNDDTSGHFSFRADALFWKPLQEGLDFFQSTSISSGLVTVDTATAFQEAITSRANDHTLHFDWRCGFRLGLGYGFGCGKWNGWDISSAWTHYQGHAKAHGRIEELQSHGHWKLDYDVVDIVVGVPECSICSDFIWKGFGGVRLAEVDQRLRSQTVSLFTLVDPTTTTTVSSASRFHNRSDFQGIGPVIGVKTDWNLGCGFSLFGNAAGSIMYGRFHTKFNNDTSTTVISTTPLTEEFTSSSRRKSHFHVCQPVVGFGIGFRWMKHFVVCNYESDLLVQLGWEHHQWFDFGKLGNNGDLSFDGVTLSAAVQF